MENKSDKNKKRKESVRKAVKKYTDGLKTKNPEKYEQLRKFHRQYNKMYYQELKEDRRKLHELLQQKRE